MSLDTDMPGDMLIPDDLIPIHASVHAAAGAIAPSAAFLDALDTRLRREAADGGALAAARAAVATAPAIGPHTAERLDPAIGTGTALNPRGLPPPGARAGRAVGRRRFLVGAAAAIVGGAFVLASERHAPAPNLAATQQALGILVPAESVAAASPTGTGGASTQPSNLDFSDGILGWGLWGSNPSGYEIGIDPNVKQHGAGSAYLRAKDADPSGFGTLSRSFTADPYRGMRLRMRGTVKADAVEDWAGLWLRVDGQKNQVLSFDNMEGRPITGTRDWQTYEIVLDVPQASTFLGFGILLVGRGEVWLNDIAFDVVGQDVPTTETSALPSQVQNLDFEAGTTGWFLNGKEPHWYRSGVDTTAPHGGSASAYLRSDGDPDGGFGTLMQEVQAGAYTGTRLRMSGWVKASGVESSAGLWMRVDGPDTRTTGHALAFDNMDNRPITGTCDWRRYGIVLDVPPNATAIAFGILLHGKGQVWLDDVSFTTVGPDVPTTNMPT